ncbi:MAG: class I SAM-dependent methyltransferase [Bacteroidota bacterium]|nr:class I SAM-dependent methyltransferase [Bacteroidota bacterium]
MKINESEHIKINEAKWDKWAATVDGKSKRYDYLRSVQMSVIALMDLKDNISILDIGCGTGFALGQVAKRVNGKGLFTGIDLSEKMIEKAKENFKGKENFQFLKANAEKIPLENNRYDIILCTNSFHHYLHQDNALKEMYRLLKPGGNLFLVDPTVDNWLIRVISRSRHLFGRDKVTFNTSKEFGQLMTAAGFKYLEPQKIVYHQKVQIGKKLMS